MDDEEDLTAAYLAGYRAGVAKANKQIDDLQQQLRTAEASEDKLWFEKRQERERCAALVESHWLDWPKEEIITAIREGMKDG